jgi:hypothetical protein
VSARTPRRSGPPPAARFTRRRHDTIGERLIRAGVDLGHRGEALIEYADRRVAYGTGTSPEAAVSNMQETQWGRRVLSIVAVIGK